VSMVSIFFEHGGDGQRNFGQKGFLMFFFGRMLVFCLITLVMLLVIYLSFVVGRSNIIRGPIILSHS